jgi:lipoprotein NlpI
MRSDNSRTKRVVAGAAALAALALTACGASTPRQTAVEPPAAVTPTTVTPAAAEPSRRERRAAEEAQARAAEPQDERRGRRESRRGDAEDVGAAAAAVEPIPEAAAQSYERALAALRAENWLEAELELEQLTAEYGSYAGPHVNLAIVYLHDGRRADARAALDTALAIEPGHAAANNQLGILLREEGKFDEAESAYRRALATDPAYALAHYNLGVLLDVYLRRPAEALEHYESYQSSLREPNEMVGRWIVDLRRRTGNAASTSRVAQGGAE